MPTTGFQTQVNQQPAPAVAGDFASANPRAVALAGPGGLVAGDTGVTVGGFAWVDEDGVTVYSRATVDRSPDGFVHRDQQALITAYLSGASMVIPEGFPVTLSNEGDFWAVNAGPVACEKGWYVYADTTDGSVNTANILVERSDGATVTASMGSTNTGSLGATFTATGSGAELTVTSVTGLISVGDTISGTGVPSGTTIESQTSGTPGGDGVYETSVATTASSATVTAFGEVVKITSTTGLISIGDTVDGGAGFPTGATIETQVSGTTGGAGVYTISARGTAYTASASGITTFGDVLNVTAVAEGALDIGMPVSGIGIPSDAVILSQESGSSGAVGIYVLDRRAEEYAASTTVTGYILLRATNFHVAVGGAVGDLIKISTWGN